MYCILSPFSTNDFGVHFVKIINHFYGTIHAPVDPQVRVRAVRTVGTVALAEHDPVLPPHYALPPSVAGGRGMTSATVAVSQFAAFVAAAAAAAAAAVAAAAASSASSASSSSAVGPPAPRAPPTATRAVLHLNHRRFRRDLACHRSSNSAARFHAPTHPQAPGAVFGAGTLSVPPSPGARRAQHHRKSPKNHRKSRPRGRKIECGRAWAVVARSWVHVRQAGTKREEKDAKLARNGPDPGPGAVAGRRRPGRRWQPPDGLRPAGGFWPPRAALGARGAARGLTERAHALRVQRAARYRERPTESPPTPPTQIPYKIFVRDFGVAATPRGPPPASPAGTAEVLAREPGAPQRPRWARRVRWDVPRRGCRAGSASARGKCAVAPRKVRRALPPRVPRGHVWAVFGGLGRQT